MKLQIQAVTETLVLELFLGKVALHPSLDLAAKLGNAFQQELMVLL
tara:strand:+ start:50 stop:187 length:138 start_codon:yes stop_codon:yes gene_type:complete